MKLFAIAAFLTVLAIFYIGWATQPPKTQSTPQTQESKPTGEPGTLNGLRPEGLAAMRNASSPDPQPQPDDDWYVKSFEFRGSLYHFEITHDGFQYDVICNPYFTIIGLNARANRQHYKMCTDAMVAAVGNRLKYAPLQHDSALEIGVGDGYDSFFVTVMKIHRIGGAQ